MAILSKIRRFENSGFWEEQRRRIIEDDDVDDLRWSHEHADMSFFGDLGWIPRSGFSWVGTRISSNSVYVRVASEGRRKGAVDYRWYAISAADLESALPQIPAILPPALTKMPPRTPHHATVVALLPRIYILGGARDRRGQAPFADAVYSYDITSPGKGWEKRPSMICARKSPIAVGLHGKVYVFGGIVDKVRDKEKEKLKLRPYVEVYDPKLDRWDGLSIGAGMNLHPSVSPFYALFVDRCNKQHLLMHMELYGSFTYSFFTDSFTHHQRQNFGCVQKAAVVDGILYCEKMGNFIYGYDLVNVETFRLPVQGIREYLGDDDCKRLSLLDGGNGRLCLLWESEVFGELDKGIIISCLVVRVSRTLSLDSQEPILQASVVSYRQYMVPGHQLEDCLVL